MGASIGSDDKKSVNVDLNIVPYIDLMSCLTAFLLVVAVWVDIAQITIQPKGKARSTLPSFDPLPVVSVLIQADTIYAGVSRLAIEPVVIKRAPGGDFDWQALENALTSFKKESDLAECNDLEVAAESLPAAPVSYGSVIHAMDLAVKVGFTQVGLTEPTSLSWRPTL